MQAATRIEIHRIFFCEVFLYLISKCFKKWSLMESFFFTKTRAIAHRTLLNTIIDVMMRCFEIPTPKTLENIQKKSIYCSFNTRLKVPPQIQYCRCSKEKGYSKISKFPEAFTNAWLFLLHYKPAKQNCLFQLCEVGKFVHHESEC